MNLRRRPMVRNISVLLFLWAQCLVGGRSSFVDIENFSKRYHLKMIQRVNTDEIYLKNEKHTLLLSAKTKEAFVDNTKVFLTYPINMDTTTHRKHKTAAIFSRKSYTVAQIDIDKILLPVLFPNKTLSKTVKTIVIDPGHGGKAEGTQNKQLKIKEKDLTLKTAKLLAEKLKRLGYVVHLTRNQDVDLPLEQRSKFANQKKADLFLSLHYNSAPAAQAQGIETFAYSFHGHPSTDGNCKNDKLASINKFDGANTCLAWQIQRKLCADLRANDRGVRRGRMVVLADLNCPGALIECGFLSHKTEASRIKTETYQRALVNAIANAIQCFKNS